MSQTNINALEHKINRIALQLQHKTHQYNSLNQKYHLTQKQAKSQHQKLQSLNLKVTQLQNQIDILNQKLAISSKDNQLLRQKNIEIESKRIKQSNEHKNQQLLMTRKWNQIQYLKNVIIQKEAVILKDQEIISQLRLKIQNQSIINSQLQSQIELLNNNHHTSNFIAIQKQLQEKGKKSQQEINSLTINMKGILDEKESKEKKIGQLNGMLQNKQRQLCQKEKKIKKLVASIEDLKSKVKVPQIRQLLQMQFLVIRNYSQQYFYLQNQNNQLLKALNTKSQQLIQINIENNFLKMQLEKIQVTQIKAHEFNKLAQRLVESEQSNIQHMEQLQKLKKSNQQKQQLLSSQAKQHLQSNKLGQQGQLIEGEQSLKHQRQLNNCQNSKIDIKKLFNQITQIVREQQPVVRTLIQQRQLVSSQYMLKLIEQKQRLTKENKQMGRQFIELKSEIGIWKQKGECSVKTNQLYQQELINKNNIIKQLQVSYKRVLSDYRQINNKISDSYSQKENLKNKIVIMNNQVRSQKLINESNSNLIKKLIQKIKEFHTKYIQTRQQSLELKQKITHLSKLHTQTQNPQQQSIDSLKLQEQLYVEKVRNQAKLKNYELIILQISKRLKYKEEQLNNSINQEVQQIEEEVQQESELYSQKVVELKCQILNQKISLFDQQLQRFQRLNEKLQKYKEQLIKAEAWFKSKLRENDQYRRKMCIEIKQQLRDQYGDVGVFNQIRELIDNGRLYKVLQKARSIIQKYKQDENENQVQNEEQVREQA